MLKRILFIASILISVAILGAILFLAFPKVRGMFSGKTQTIQGTELSSIQNMPAEDVSAEKPQNDNSAEQGLDASQAPQKAPETIPPAKNSSEVGTKPAPAAKDPKTETTSETKSAGDIVQRLVSFGFQKASDRKIDTIIIHSNYNKTSSDSYDVSGCIAQFKSYGVSAHYLIARDGKIYQLVEEKNIAWHAGVSKVPDGRTNVNDFSIGIELITKESADHPTDGQYAALNSLISGIKKRYSIKYVLGHDDIAPGRKTDPWGIDWKLVSK